MVVSIELCPAMEAITGNGWPEFPPAVRNVRRRTCQVKRRMPSVSHTGQRSRQRRFRSWKGVPASLGKSQWEGPGRLASQSRIAEIKRGPMGAAIIHLTQRFNPAMLFPCLGVTSVAVLTWEDGPDFCVLER
jgi:hypothetical protein